MSWSTTTRSPAKISPQIPQASSQTALSACVGANDAHVRQRVGTTPELRAARKPRERDERQQTSDIDRPACTATSVRVEPALRVYERVGEERKRSDNDCADRETEDDVVLHERSMDSGSSL